MKPFLFIFLILILIKIHQLQSIILQLGHQFQYVIKLIQQEDVQRKFITIIGICFKAKERLNH